MYFPSIIRLLSVVGSNIVEQLPETCDGGYCLPKHLCSTGRANDVPVHEQNELITLRVDEDNECGDFMKICCKRSNTDSNMTDTCGISNPQGLVYHVESNLTYAKYAEFPWTVAIFRTPSSSDNDALTYIGEGALIHPKFVLTTAHTLKKLYRYVARFGEWNMKSDAEIYPAQDVEVEDQILHPLYRGTWTPQNDIALAVLQENVIYSEHIRPLCLPSAQDVVVGKRCIAAGWGWDVHTEQPASIMKRLVLKVAPRKRCRLLYRRIGIPLPQHRTIMCAIAAEGQNTCFKDDGTPLACQKEDGSYVLAGLAISRCYCERSDDPGVFVNVAKFVSWVHETIEGYVELLAKEEIARQ